MTIKQLVTELRKLWIVVAQFVCWAVVTIGGFMPAVPLKAITAPETTLQKFAQFIGSVLIGIMLVFCLRYGRRRHTKWWLIVCGAVCLATVVGYFLLRTHTRDWTCRYAGREIVIGSRLTADAALHAQTLPDSNSCEMLLGDYGGNSAAVWEPDDVNRRHTILLILTMIVWLGAFACIVSVGQCMRCAQARV